MRIIEAMKNSAPSASVALFEKAVSTLTETRVACVYPAEINSSGEITSYRIETVVHYPFAKQGGTTRTSLSNVYPSKEAMREEIKRFFSEVRTRRLIRPRQKEARIKRALKFPTHIEDSLDS